MNDFGPKSVRTTTDYGQAGRESPEQERERLTAALAAAHARIGELEAERDATRARECRLVESISGVALDNTRGDVIDVQAFRDAYIASRAAVRSAALAVPTTAEGAAPE